MRHPGSGRRRAIGVAALLVIAVVCSGCVSQGRAAIEADDTGEGVELLRRPLPGDLAALYDLRVARSGGLRLAVVTAGDEGRITVSEPFGAAVSITAWTDHGPAVFYDLGEGCRREVFDLEEVLGIGALPLGQAVHLLGGRLPVAPGDELVIGDGGSIDVRGVGWAARLVLAPDPWRVVEATELRRDGTPGWKLELDSHTSSVPGRIRLENADGRWAELELKRLEWPDGISLPDLPGHPSCGGRRE